MNMMEAVAGFLTMKAGHIAPGTLALYRRYLCALVRHVGDVDTANVTARVFNGYLSQLVVDGYSPYTIRGTHSVMRVFWAYLVAVGAAPSNVAREVPFIRPPRKLPKAISDRDLTRVLARLPDEPIQYRAIVLFLADTGCRVGGLCGLSLDEVELPKHRALVFEKDKRQRWVYFTDCTALALSAHLDERPRVRHSFVFSTKWGNPYTPRAVYATLDRIGKRAGVTGRVNPHSFRHAFARTFLQNGGNLAALARLLGHSPGSPITAQYYAVWDDRELAEIHDRYSPLRDR